MRQWLNSDKGVGEWWTPQNDYDRCPDQLATKAGFLTGLTQISWNPQTDKGCNSAQYRYGFHKQQLS